MQQHEVGKRNQNLAGSRKELSQLVVLNGRGVNRHAEERSLDAIVKAA